MPGPYAFALCAAGLAFGLAYRSLVNSGNGAWDLSWALRGAELLRAGIDPYGADLFAGTRLYDVQAAFRDDPLFYPLPAVLLVLPLAYLPYEIAGALFSAAGTGLLTFAVLRRAPHLWPLLLSANLYTAVFACTWVPLLAAAALLPAASPLLVVKPALGAALWLARPSWRALWGGLALVAASLVVLPTWPLSWLEVLRRSHHPIPALVLPFGPLLLGALLRWRGVEARRLALLACMPQILAGADQLLLFLCCRSSRQAAAMAAWSWVVYSAAWSGLLKLEDMGFPALVPLLYVPALAMVLWREGAEASAGHLDGGARAE